MSNQLNINDIRKKFLDFFKSKNHAILNSASLITSDEKGVTDSTLFNTAGVQPLIPYLLGEEHPLGNRLASAQKCLRTIDIDEVGDNTHLTFFEMLGNWSLGDYFKKESIGWSYEFLTNSEIGLGLDPKRIYATVFAGNEQSPKDEEAFNEWKKYLPENQIFFLESNWWEAGDNGPCGPDTEIFYDLTTEGLNLTNLEAFLEADEKSEVVEIWNNVFMQFRKENGVVVSKLPKFSVDTGAGLERVAVVINKLENIYELDHFQKMISYLKSVTSEEIIAGQALGVAELDVKYRIIADHVKASAFLISDGAIPANTDRGYILRRLIRRAINLAQQLKIGEGLLSNLVDFVVEEYHETYSNLEINHIKNIFNQEESKFRKTLEKGLKELNKIIQTGEDISGEMAFNLFTTYGFPIELIKEIADENNLNVDAGSFRELMKDHQEKSRTAAAGKFKGGLEQLGEIETRYHTATHLLQQALRQVLGESVAQKGSNINSDRLRFDFSYGEKLSDEQKTQIENIVNQKIQEKLPVNKIELPKEEAVKCGAVHLFDQKYPDMVSVYYVGNSLDEAFSKEFCGGPHVSNISELGHFKIKKEEASAAGVRRIKAVLE